MATLYRLNCLTLKVKIPTALASSNPRRILTQLQGMIVKYERTWLMTRCVLPAGMAGKKTSSWSSANQTIKTDIMRTSCCTKCFNLRMQTTKNSHKNRLIYNWILHGNASVPVLSLFWCTHKIGGFLCVFRAVFVRLKQLCTLQWAFVFEGCRCLVKIIVNGLKVSVNTWESSRKKLSSQDLTLGFYGLKNRI